ncbi:oligopeptide transport system permease protein [Aequitasia blattaphilus]|uniref:ABC transporter permease n=1 Tax=Aequitasia blattaphilus TaxID=2949332 RepID=A0ABT1E8M0_9FIRM|nr:ABC transporter permease [Aequitasia blattaphilus]MCP1102160.1 ABC transporter permease [Aequitasia blattaphilus]MCR8614800.1 ABC transporter permease [Aequitasia blattaphilus]
MIQWVKKHKARTILCLLLLLFVLIAFLGPFFSKYTYFEQNGAAGNLPPSGSYIFGTDKFGRDLFIRVCMGTQITLFVGFGNIVISGIFGLIYGGIAGYIGGRVDTFLMSIADIIISIPSLLYIILIVLVWGGSVWTILIGISISGWVETARIVRGEVRKQRYKEFVLAARLAGGGHIYVFFRHLMPGMIGTLRVSFTNLFLQGVLTEAFLSFMGIGIVPPKASLGTLIKESVRGFFLYPWQMFFPVLILCLLVLFVQLMSREWGGSLKCKRYEL